MTTLFGPRVIGKEAYEKQQRMVETGRLHFGPRVVGNPPSFHGKDVVGPATASQQQTITEVTGAISRLDDLKQAQLQAICDKLGIDYRPVGESNASLIAKIRAKYIEHGAVPPSAGVAVSTSEANVTVDELVHAPADLLPDLLQDVTDQRLLEEAFHKDDREWALDAYARRAQELSDGNKAK